MSSEHDKKTPIQIEKLKWLTVNLKVMFRQYKLEGEHKLSTLGQMFK